MARHSPKGTAGGRGTSGCCAPWGGWHWVPRGGSSHQATPVDPGMGTCCVESGWASPTARTARGAAALSPWMGAGVLRVSAMACAMLAHAVREGLRTVTMASVLRRLWPDVPFLFWQWDVPAGPSGAAQSTARGHGGPGDWRWLGGAGCLGTQGSQGAQDSLPVTAAQGGGGLTQRPDAITAGAGDAQGVGHQPSRTPRALLQSCPVPLPLG